MDDVEPRSDARTDTHLPSADGPSHCGGHYAETGTVGTREGHQFHFSVATQGEGADWVGEPIRVTVRAWSLSAACTKAAAIPLADWTYPPEAAAGTH